jgi:beta-lactam-binding protein with PASTA domain
MQTHLRIIKYTSQKHQKYISETSKVQLKTSKVQLETSKVQLETSEKLFLKIEWSKTLHLSAETKLYFIKQDHQIATIDNQKVLQISYFLIVNCR